MRSPSKLEELHKAFLSDPSDPNYAYRLNTYNLERMARIHRAMVIGELMAEGIVWLARLPVRLVRAGRRVLSRTENLRSAGAD
jgi:hypothetical protein